MRKLFLITFICTTLFACSKDKKYAQIDKHWWIYEKAREVGDNETAINAIYEVMYLDSNEFIYNDTLTMLYFEEQRYADCISSAKRSLRFHTELESLRMGVKAALRLNQPKDVVFLGEFLLDKEPDNLPLLYDMVVQQLNLDNLPEAKSRIDQLLAHPSSFIVTKKQVQSDGSVLDVPLSVCTTNLLGVFYWKSGNGQLAQTMFEQAISQQPNYDAALDNLKQLTAITD